VSGGAHSASAVISSLVQPPITECPTASLAGPDHLISGNLNATLRADGGLTFTRVSDGKVMLSEKSVWRLTPTTTTPPIAGFSSLEMAIDGMERRANASTVSASTPRSLGIPAFRLRVSSARRLCLAMLPLFFDFHDDSGSQIVDDEQMFGPDYLVAPVLHKGVASRRV